MFASACRDETQSAATRPRWSGATTSTQVGRVRATDHGFVIVKYRLEYLTLLNNVNRTVWPLSAIMNLTNVSIIDSRSWSNVCPPFY